MPAASRMALSAIATGEAGCLKLSIATLAKMQAAGNCGLSGLVQGTISHIDLPVCADYKALLTRAKGAVVATLQVCGDCSFEAGEGGRVASGQQGQSSLCRHADSAHCMCTPWGQATAVQPSPVPCLPQVAANACVKMDD